MVVVAGGLVLSGMLGVASAEAPTSPAPTPTVSVDGVATVPLAQGANQATATAAYRAAMGAALEDGHTKAEYLASKAGVTLGNVQSIVEGDGSIECKSAVGEGEPAYVEYEGERPDFGSRASVVAPDAAAESRAAQTVRPDRKKKKKKKKPTAKPATAATCTLGTDVALAYAIS